MTDTDREKAAGTHTPRIIVSWALVGIPLAYGIYEAVKASTQLFTG
ncbi:MFS transporter small subunit [Kribbella sp. GL6]